jgi:hypothetical protein
VRGQWRRDTPLYAGFGISTPDDARAAAELTDGVIVGSRALEAAAGGPDELRGYVRTLRNALDSAEQPGRKRRATRRPGIAIAHSGETRHAVLRIQH